MFYKAEPSKQYDFINNGYKRYIITKKSLSVHEEKLLGELLAFFPHALTSGFQRAYSWHSGFKALNVEEIPKDLLHLAANAYDVCGNTMLGVAAEAGDTNAVKRLIDMGADLNTVDRSMGGHLALHWAIDNKLAFADRNSEESLEVVKCLLAHGARTDIACRGLTPLEYAKKYGFNKAAALIEESESSLFLSKLFGNFPA